MIHILNNIHGYNADWCFEEFKKIIKPEHKIAIIAFAFRDKKIPNAKVWESFYGCPNGIYYQGFVNTFKDFGIAAEQLEILNYYQDTPASALEKIRKADILYFLGGLPEVMMARLEEFGLVEAIQRVLRERRKPVYAVGNAGALIVDEAGMRTVGDVTVFEAI